MGRKRVFKATIKFDNEDALKDFMTWMIEAGDQEWANWYECSGEIPSQIQSWDIPKNTIMFTSSDEEDDDDTE